VQGGGSFAANYFRTNSLEVKGAATAQAALSNINNAGTSKLNQLIIESGSTLDLVNNDLIVTGMSRAVVEPLVAGGRGTAGDWKGTGITSSAAAAFAAGGTHALGVITASDGGYQTTGFAGLTVSGSDTLVKYTYSGDANLDGTVNFDDFNKFLAGYGNPAGNPARWFTGDFTYDGFVNFDDFNKFLAGYNYFNVNGQVALGEGDLDQAQFAALLAGDATPAPEPVMIAPLAMLALLARRRRRGPASVI
jgi:hypothetical protein